MTQPPDPFPTNRTNYTQDEWDALRAAYPPGTPVSGVAISRQPFGVFVQLDELPGVVALLEFVCFSVLENDPEHRIRHWEDFPQLGSRIEARIIWWHRQPTDEVRLTQLSRHNWDDLRNRALDDLQKS